MGKTQKIKVAWACGMMERQEIRQRRNLAAVQKRRAKKKNRVSFALDAASTSGSEVSHGIETMKKSLRKEAHMVHRRLLLHHLLLLVMMKSCWTSWATSC